MTRALVKAASGRLLFLAFLLYQVPRMEILEFLVNEAL